MFISVITQISSISQQNDDFLKSFECWYLALCSKLQESKTSQKLLLHLVDEVKDFISNFIGQKIDSEVKQQCLDNIQEIMADYLTKLSLLETFPLLN